MVHQPVPLLATGFDLCSNNSNLCSNNDSKPSAFAPTTTDSHYFPPSPISESGSSSQTKPVAEQSGNFEHQYQQRRRSHENLDEGYQRPNGLQIDFHEADGYEERVEDEQFDRVGERGVDGRDRVVLGGSQRGSPVDYPTPDYCTPLVIKVIVLIMLLRMGG